MPRKLGLAQSSHMFDLFVSNFMDIWVVCSASGQGDCNSLPPNKLELNDRTEATTGRPTLVLVWKEVDVIDKHEGGLF